MHHGAAPPGWHAVIGELVCLPAELDDEVHLFARQIAQVGNVFRQRDWVMLDEQPRRRGQPQSADVTAHVAPQLTYGSPVRI